MYINEMNLLLELQLIQQKLTFEQYDIRKTTDLYGKKKQNVFISPKNIICTNDGDLQHCMINKINT